MGSLTVLDFERARDVATECLFRANALIQAARREPDSFPWAGRTLIVNHLAPAVGSYCDFLDASRSAIGRVQPYTQLVVTEPVRHAGLCYATAHDLAWAFAHRVWLSAANVVSTALVMAGRSDEWTATATFSLDGALVSEHLSEIRDRLREKLPIDAVYFGALIRIESRKAVVAFTTELGSALGEQTAQREHPSEASPALTMDGLKLLVRQQVKAETKTSLTDDVYVKAYRHCGSLRKAAAFLTAEVGQEIGKDAVHRAVKRFGGTSAVVRTEDSESIQRAVASQRRDRQEKFASPAEPREIE